jgi:hypothetical protein
MQHAHAAFSSLPLDVTVPVAAGFYFVFDFE